jgi:heptose I phosphotransferase
MQLHLTPLLQQNHLTQKQQFDYFLSVSGEIYRQVANRKTVYFHYQNRTYFIKIHRGVGWKEIIKNWLTLRLPVLGAMDEWKALQRLKSLSIDTLELAGYGVIGWNPAQLTSFVITNALENTVSLEELCLSWKKQPPLFIEKVTLIKKLASISYHLHQNGINHRDYYLCHFLLDKTQWQNFTKNTPLRLFLIDLHRVQLRKKTPFRWLVKDIGGLYFSALHIGLSKRDCFRFMKIYHRGSLREVLQQYSQFWIAVEQRALLLEKK